MTRLIAATALLVVIAATPALALVCEAECAQPASHGRASHVSHEHHDSGRQASGFRLPAFGLKANFEDKCRSHFAIEPATPERSSTLATEAAPPSLRLLEPLVSLTRAGALAKVRPPLESGAATPLRI
jgi:hypothetical protein